MVDMRGEINHMTRGEALGKIKLLEAANKELRNKLQSCSVDIKSKSLLTKIVTEIKDCSECPNVNCERTKGAGYAFDYSCTLMNNKKIMGYCEYPSDYKPVPDWCPIRLKKEV